MRSKLFLVLIFVLFSVHIADTTDAAAQSGINDLIITAVDNSEFPQMTIRFRTRDANGLPVSTLQLDQFEVSENGRGVDTENLTKTEDGVWVHFVVDAGLWMVGSRWTNAETALTDFLQTTPWMKENLDHVALTVVPSSGAQNLVPFTGDANQVLTAVKNYSPPGGDDYSAPVTAIDEIMEEMALIPEARNQPKFIVLLSSGLESGSAAQIAALGRSGLEKQIPIYVIGLRADQSAGLEDLAAASGGFFTLYNRLTDVAPLYAQLISYREQYEITYRSAVNQSGNQAVELTANVSASGSISDLADYDIEVNPPRVLINNPQAGDVILRQAPEYTEDRAAIEPTTTSVVASVIFPDDHLRRLQEAVLLADGVIVDSLTRPNPTNDLEFTWDLHNVQQDGVNDFSLEVEITDELGLVSRSPAVEAKVEVIVPTLANENMIVPTVDVEAIKDEVREDIESTMVIATIKCFDFTPDWICDNIERPVRRNWISFLAITISVVFSAVVWVNRDKGPIKDMRNTIARGVETLTKRYRGPSEAKAYLVVLEGDINVSKSLEIFGDTPIGRSKQNAELLFQQYDESSPLSRLHCTIVDEEDHFLLRDEDSANGTYLNGSRLIPLQPEVLHDGDEIELARVERGGVRLSFQMARPGDVDDYTVADGEMPSEFSETRQTGSAEQKAVKDAEETIIDDGYKFN